VSGPGTATIASPASLTTNVSFPAVVGTYVLRLTASDTALSAHDDVNVYVRGGAAVMNLHLPLDEGAGTLAADTSGNGHNGALTSTAWTTGAIGGGVHFDGNSSYIRVSNFAFGPEFSIAFWFKPEGLDTDGGYHYLFSWGGVTSPNDVTVWFTTALEGGIGKAVRTSAQDNDDSSPATPVMDVHDPNEAVFSDGAWHHYCLTVAKDSGRTVFVDGIAKLNDHLGGGDSIAPTTDLFLGGRSDLDPARFYKGSLDDVRVYTGALTDAEVQALVAPGINRPPTANAGADRSIMLPYAAALAGTVSDDGRPGPGACTARWSMISGPGTVAFADANAAATSATFSLPGAYVLRLTASDSILSATDDVTITVKAAGDFNGDGNVNGQDFLIWQTHYPTLCGATTDTGDANGDGMVNGQDFLIWQANYKPM
jgi:hypothetical protein